MFQEGDCGNGRPTTSPSIGSEVASQDDIEAAQSLRWRSTKICQSGFCAHWPLKKALEAHDIEGHGDDSTANRRPSAIWQTVVVSAGVRRSVPQRDCSGTACRLVSDSPVEDT